MKHRGTVIFLAASLACACAPAAAPEPATPAAKAPATPEPSRSKIDIRSFAFTEPDLIAYLKAKELSSLPGYADWLEVHPQARRVNQLFERLRAGCNLEPFEVVDEVLFTALRDQLVGAVRVRLGEEEVFACAESLVGGGTRTEVADHPSLRSPDESFVLTLVEDILLFGDEATVTERIRSHQSYAGRIAPSLPDLRDVLAFARMETEEGAVDAIESRFVHSNEGLRLSVRMRSPSAEEADWVLGAMRRALDNEIERLVGELPEEARTQAAQLLAKAEINRRVGQSVEVVLPVKALAQGQILLVALVDRLGEAIMRTQHVEEARLVLELLAIRMQAYAESHPREGRPAFTPSAPRTPEQPTPGSEGVEQAADWSHPTWKALGFEPPVGLTHAYEIESTKDDRKTVIRAVADLDGDGDPSILEVELEVVDEAVTVGDVTTRGDAE